MSVVAGSQKILTKDGHEVLVSDCDFIQLSSTEWTTFGTKKLYARGYAGGGRVLMHRYIAGLSLGDLLTVDHINGNSLDNRRENLRICSQKENSWNRRVTHAKTSLYGVIENNGKYIVKFKNEGQDVYVGTFDTSIEAAHEYNKKIVMLRGEYAATNTIDKNELRLALEKRALDLREQLGRVEEDINGLSTFH